MAIKLAPPYLAKIFPLKGRWLLRVNAQTALWLDFILLVLAIQLAAGADGFRVAAYRRAAELFEALEGL